MDHLTLERVDKMNLNELRVELTKRNSSVEGKKMILKHRLMSLVIIENQNDNEVDEDEEEGDQDYEDANRNNNSEEDDSEEEIIVQDDNVSIRSITNKQDKKKISCFNFRDVEDSLDCFKGDGVISVEKWIEDFENVAQIAGWGEPEKLVYGRKLLGGAARQFVRAEQGVNSWIKLKNGLLAEFKIRVNSREVHEQLRMRRKKADESAREYVYAMKVIANQIKLDDKSLIDYIVDGIQDTNVNKLILRGVRTISELKVRLEEYEQAHKSVDKKDRYENKSVGKNNSDKKPQNVNKTVHDTSKSESRCYNCGNVGHAAKECPRTGDGPKCFKCRSFGHIAKNCDKNVKKEEVKQVTVASATVSERKMVKLIMLNGQQVESLVDTGSAVNLMRKDLYNLLELPILSKTDRSFTGIGQASVKPEGKISLEIIIDDEKYVTAVYVVPNNTMSVSMIIGRDLLEQAEVLFGERSIMFKKLCDPCSEEVDEADRELLNVLISVDECQIDVEPKYYDDIKQMMQDYNPKSGTETKIKTTIVLSDETPIYQKLRRLAPLEKQVVEVQVKEWLRDGIITESSSDFASPVVVVRKKNGDYRVCIDFRQLNHKVIKDRFPMANMEDQIDKLSSAKVFSVIDLKNGFFHVPVAEESRKYTAFLTHLGLYEFTKTPFGLCNSPASFGRLINDVFRDLISTNIVIPYVDDLIIPARNEREALQNLQQVMFRASEWGLIINWKKCQFLKRSVEYLGYTICDSSVQPAPTKMKAVKCFPVPESAQQVQRFLGLAGYFRKFVKGFATIAAPLTELLKKDAVFVFDERQQIAFKTLKRILIERPVLRIYNPSAVSELHTDACGEGLGAILLQRDNDEQQFHAVHYWSRKLRPAEKKYHSYELEVLAIVSAIKKFRHYLLGIKFKLVTDCAAFKRTVEKKEIPHRVARWTLTLQDFQYVMEHRPGERMKHVDALSRGAVFLVEELITSLLMENQTKDEKIQAIKTILEQQGQYDNYSICNGVLMKQVNGKDVIVVPEKMINEIIRRMHEKGHFGLRKTKELIEREYYIPKMAERVEEYISCCMHCILIERKRGKKEGELHVIPKGELPLETYHIDHLGPMTAVTSKGYKYIFVVVDAFSKFVWMYPTKTTNSREVVDRLETQAKTFGYPKRIISDRGSAFTSQEFENYCDEKNIEHLKITTGVPRGNGQVERMNQTIIPVLAKLTIDDLTKWYRYVDRVQRCINSTHQRAINTSPHEALTGVKLRDVDDREVTEILQQELISSFNSERESLRKAARESIQRIQEEQKKGYDRRCKKAAEYQEGDIVAVKRTQFGVGMKLRPKFLGPYIIQKKMQNDRYAVKKLSGEGPQVTTTSADQIKRWG